MIFCNVDESGDPGLSLNSPSRYFILVGLIIDAVDFQNFSTELHRFRQHLSTKYGLLVSEEIHASAFISSPGAVARISLNDRLRILLDCLDWCRQRTDMQLLTVGLDKRHYATDTVFQDAWRRLLLRFEEHLATAGPSDTPTQGLVFCDNTDGAKLASVVNSLRQPIDFSLPMLRYLLGTPILQDSHKSYLLQLADVVAYFATQSLAPNERIRKKGAHNYFNRLQPINLLKSEHPNGILFV